MPAEARVSAVIPAYDAARYLGAAIESTLGQTAPPWEVIVVDDGSRDGTAEVARRFPVRYVPQEHRGIGAARNRGLEAADGDFVGFLDADDVWAPRKLELQLRAFDAHRAADLVFGLVEQFRSPELDPETAARLRCRPDPQPGHLISAMLARRAVFEAVGPFRCDLSVGEFVDWITRAHELSVGEVLVEEIVLRRRLHATNHSAVARAHRNDLARVMKESLDRRRAASGDA
jgi:glycosyltransferase involved in cell wall biosynthesis